MGIARWGHRNRTAHYVEDVMETACGLHNFRLSYRRLAIAEAEIRQSHHASLPILLISD